MDLIQSLQEDILKPDVELSSILRKAKVLASTLKNREIKVWLDKELNGYQSEEELPEYRIFSASNAGYFIDDCGTQLDNLPISPFIISNEKIRNDLTKLEIRTGVKFLESTIKTGERIFKYRWPAEVTQIYSRSFLTNATCMDAWKVISVQRYEQILDNIRTRLLDFLLELQEQYPDIQKSYSHAQEIPERDIKRIFYTTVYGGQCSIGNNLENCHVVQQLVQENDLKSLIEYLKSIGVPLNEIENLNTSIQKDSKEEISKGIGSNVKNWISNLSGKVISGAFDKTLDISLDFIKTAILAYYGLK